MKTSILGVIFAFALAVNGLAADENADKTITRSFPVSPDGQLTLVVDRGDVELVTGNQNTAVVVVQREVTGGSESQAVKLLKEHQVTFTHEDNELRIRASSAKPAHNWFSSAPGILRVHFQITLPRGFNASINTGGGNIAVTGLRGTVEAKSSGGDLSFTKIEGAVDGHTGGGNILASACTDRLQIQTSGGNITIKNYSGPAAQADSSGGNITATDCTGKVLLKTSGGNVALENFSGPAAYADTGGGGIALDLAQQPAGDCFFHSGGGNFTVKLADTLTLNLNAVTEAGIITSSITVTETSKHAPGMLEGKINGGGPLLSLKTSGGNIELRQR